MSGRRRDLRRRASAESGFRVRRLSVYAFVGVVVLSIASLLLRPSREGKSAEASAYSYSAIGHHGFVRWLTRLGVPNRVAPSRPTRDLGPGDTLTMIAPDPCDSDTRCYRFSYNIRRAIDAGANVLVVLPRWTASDDERRPSIAAEVEALARDDVAEVLARTLIAAQHALKPHEVESMLADELWYEDAFAALNVTVSPDLAVRSGAASQQWVLDLGAAQVLDGAYESALAPIVEAGSTGELLVGRVRGTNVVIVTDPTFFGNAALADGDHAELIAWLLFEVLATRAVIIDETIHVHQQAPRVWDTLFEMPIVPLTLHVMLVFVMMLWIASRRFDLPVDRDAARPRGTAALIASAAAILEEGAAGGPALAAYWEMTIRDVARAYSLPPELSHVERIQRLRTLETAPGLGAALADLGDDVARLEGLPRRRHAQPRILKTARDIHHFRESIAHGYTAN